MSRVIFHLPVAMRVRCVETDEAFPVVGECYDVTGIVVVDKSTYFLLAEDESGGWSTSRFQPL